MLVVGFWSGRQSLTAVDWLIHRILISYRRSTVASLNTDRLFMDITFDEFVTADFALRFL